MRVIVRNIIPPKQAEATQFTQYTAVNCRTIIDRFSVTNTSAAPVLFNINLVPSGATASAANQVLRDKSIGVGESYSCPEIVGHTLEPGGFISTLAGAAASLSIRASGREIT